MEMTNAKRPAIAELPRAPKVLIVEDDLTQEPIWSYILGKVDPRLAYDWVTSESAAEQMIERSTAENRHYDLIISDIFLAGIETGLDLWSRYHSQLHGKIILASGLEYIDVLTNMGKDRGTTPAYLRKPLVPHECIETIYGMLCLR